MGQHDYAVTEIGTYGVREQPTVVARMRPHLRATAVGLVAAMLGALAAVVAAFTLPRFSDGAFMWPWVLVGSAVVMLAICALQAWIWNEAMAEWSGRRDVNLALHVRPSWWAHLLSYVAIAATLAAALWVAVDAGAASLPGGAAIAAAVLLVVAQLTAAVEYFRLEGPPGTLPAHFRQLLRAQNPERAEWQAPADADDEGGDDPAVVLRADQPKR